MCYRPAATLSNFDQFTDYYYDWGFGMENTWFVPVRLQKYFTICPFLLFRFFIYLLSTKINDKKKC